MKIILLQDIKGIGKKFDVKELKDGYVRNFLLPKGLVKIVTEKLLEEIANKKIAIEKRKNKFEETKESVIKKLSNKEFHFYVKVGEEGGIFGVITKKNIIKAFDDSLNFIEPDLRKEIFRKIKIDLPRSLKTLGEHEIEISIGSDAKFKIKAILNQDGIK